MEVNIWLIIILSVLLLISVGMLLLLRWDIKKMTNQLEEIIQHFGTNEFIRTNTHSKTMASFILKVNQLIHLFKQDQQRSQQKEKSFKQEITNISHDLRTPLTSMKGFSELLTDTSLSEEERTEYLEIVQKKIDQLTWTVDLFYELSQIDSIDYEIMMEQLYLDQIIVETMFMFYNDFEKRQLKINVDEARVSSIFADYKATNRIIMNIIQNALRYAQSYLTINLVEGDEYIQLKATNDVNEFDRTQLDQIFDRTFSSDIGRADGQLGLGLHIVQRLIQKQGGKVHADVQNKEFRMDVSFRKWD